LWVRSILDLVHRLGRRAGNGETGVGFHGELAVGFLDERSTGVTSTSGGESREELGTYNRAAGFLGTARIHGASAPRDPCANLETLRKHSARAVPGIGIMKEIEIECPCCRSQLRVDVLTSKVLRSDRAEPSGKAADPWSSAQEKVRRRSESGQEKLEKELERERGKSARLDDLFRETRKKLDGPAEG
jgi:hypothetical protein